MIPEVRVPRIARSYGHQAIDETSWESVPAIALRRAQDGADPVQPTTVRVARDAEALLLRFDCVDRDIWATHTVRDAPLWEEEVVEAFVAPGEADPRAYIEIEVNPLGTVFDARIVNPHGERASMRVDASWTAAGLVAKVDRSASQLWRAEISIRWTDLCEGLPPRVWRANFFRVDRPRGGKDEFTCWSPTFADPPDFHKPECFGRLILHEE